MIAGLIYGIPQLMYAEKVFERKYNAKSIVKVGAGCEISYKDFTGNNIRRLSDKIISTQVYQENAAKLGRILLSLGETKNIYENKS